VRRREPGEQTRAKILRTAKRLFVEKGYFNTSVKDIAREAGISPATVYHYFSGKEEIAGEICREVIAAIRRGIERAISRGGSAEEKIKGIMEELVSLAWEDMYAVEYAMRAKHTLNVPSCSEEPYKLLREFFREEKRRGNIKNLSEDLCAICLTGAPIGLVQLKRDGTIKGELNRFTEELTKCLWRSLKP